MADPIARVHVNTYEPEVYTGEDALELALIMANQMREDFPGAVVGVSYNPAAAEAKRRRVLARFAPNPDGSGVMSDPEHADWCHVVIGCIAPNHCTCETDLFGFNPPISGSE